MLYATLRNLMLAGALVLAALAPFIYPPDLSGTWRLELKNAAMSEQITVSIQQRDSQLSGAYLDGYRLSHLNGTIQGNTVVFSYMLDGVPINHIALLNGTSLIGEYHAGDFDWGEFRGRKVR